MGWRCSKTVLIRSFGGNGGSPAHARFCRRLRRMVGPGLQSRASDPEARGQSGASRRLPARLKTIPRSWRAPGMRSRRSRPGWLRRRRLEAQRRGERFMGYAQATARLRRAITKVAAPGTASTAIGARSSKSAYPRIAGVRRRPGRFRVVPGADTPGPLSDALPQGGRAVQPPCGSVSIQCLRCRPRNHRR